MLPPDRRRRQEARRRVGTVDARPPGNRPPQQTVCIWRRRRARRVHFVDDARTLGRGGGHCRRNIAGNIFSIGRNRRETCCRWSRRANRRIIYRRILDGIGLGNTGAKVGNGH